MKVKTDLYQWWFYGGTRTALDHSSQIIKNNSLYTIKTWCFYCYILWYLTIRTLLMRYSSHVCALGILPFRHLYSYFTLHTILLQLLWLSNRGAILKVTLFLLNSVFRQTVPDKWKWNVLSFSITALNTFSHQLESGRELLEQQTSFCFQILIQ